MGLLDKWDARNQRIVDAHLEVGRAAWAGRKRRYREVETPEGDPLAIVVIPRAEYFRPPLPWIPFLVPWNLVTRWVFSLVLLFRVRLLPGWKVGVLTNRRDLSLKRPRVLHVEHFTDVDAAEMRLAEIAADIAAGSFL